MCLKKNTTKQGFNVLKTCTVIRGKFERFHVCFLVQKQYGLVWKHNFLN